jgi:2-polyprenyl-6-methoxyphenol hydroxylase-like FAD-dependent oxidoreductase
LQGDGNATIMDSSPIPKTTPDIAIVGGGPSGLVLAIALACRGIPTEVFERDADPKVAPRFNPDRSYTIDISGHGLKAAASHRCVFVFRRADDSVQRS